MESVLARNPKVCGSILHRGSEPFLRPALVTSSLINKELFTSILFYSFFFLNSRGQPVASNDKENSEVGVVSNVAIYSLKAKLGKLETETQTLKENVKKLEKEKSTLSLLNTEARYFVC